MVSETASTPDETQRVHWAAHWHALLEGQSPSETDFVAFTAWLESDPRNREAFDAVDAAANEATAHLAACGDLPLVAAAPSASARRRAMRAFVGMAALAAVVLAVIVARPEFFTPPESEIIATAAGERRDVNLADGSILHLNTSTQVSVTMSGASRSVRLEKGEALFEVARDTDRPFDLAVGDRRVRVVGTVFNVLRHGGRITVSVERGAVDVLAEGARTHVRLGAGEQYAAREGVQSYQVAKVDPAIARAWRDGRAVFSDATLSEVVSDLSRYYGRPIVVPDPETARLRFSGILKIEDQLTTVRRLAALLPIVVTENADEVRLERGTSTK